VSGGQHTQNELVWTIRKAAAACNVTPPVIRLWIKRRWLAEPPWTLGQLHRLRDATDPAGLRRGPGAAHGTQSRWLEGCDCDPCRRAMNATAKARFRRRAQTRLPAEVRRQLLDAIYAGQPFRVVLRDLGLTPNQVWGLAKTDEAWSTALESALLATRRGDLKHGTNAAYVAGCVCCECRTYQSMRMARSRG
jgi:hypothetical protein